MSRDLTIEASNPKPSPPSGPSPTGEEAFQKLQLRIAAKSTERVDAPSLIQLFCRATREFFQVSGVYFWRRHSGDELVGEQADGKLAENFIGLRLLPQQSAVTADAVRSRRTIFVNQVQFSSTFPTLRQFEARSLMAAPLMVFDEVIGAVTFLHDSDEEFFNSDLATKATILAGQLSSLLEAARLAEASREEHRRAEILAEVANALHGTPDVAAVLEALADRLRLLLRTRMVSVLLRREGPFELRAVSAETPQMAHSFRAGHDRQTIRFAADLAQRAVSAGEAITISISSDQHSLGSLVTPGILIAAPFRTSRTQGAILVYPRPDNAFTDGRKVFSIGHRWIRRRGRCPRRALRHGSGSGTRTSPVAGNFFRAQLQRRSGTFSAGFRGARRRLPRLRPVFYCAARRRTSFMCVMVWIAASPGSIDTFFLKASPLSPARQRSVLLGRCRATGGRES